jgi:YidC/Oxa1 family membrane protein insertase
MNNTNLILSIILSIAIIIGWQHFYEKPRLNNLAKYQAERIELKKTEEIEQHKTLQLDEAMHKTPRTQIKNTNILGSINLMGARIDDLVLLKYNEELQDKKHVRLFAPSNTKESYFAEVGWYSLDSSLKLPNSQTLWTLEEPENEANKNQTVLNWTNEDGAKFTIKFLLDDNYMIKIEQSINNASDKTMSVKSYALINRNYSSNKSDTILHQGPISVIGGELKEFSYSKLKDEGKKSFKNVNADWVGITDKYWLAAFIPTDTKESAINFNYSPSAFAEKFQVDILSEMEIIQPGIQLISENSLFDGAKEVKLL